MLKKLLHYFKSYFKEYHNNEYGLTIFLKPDSNIDVQFIYPNLYTGDDYSIINIAEKYAQLLLYINSTALTHKLQDYISEQSKKNDNIKHKLFFDNVVFFHDTMLQNIRANRYKNEPLIRPISVFNVK